MQGVVLLQDLQHLNISALDAPQPGAVGLFLQCFVQAFFRMSRSDDGIRRLGQPCL